MTGHIEDMFNGIAPMVCSQHLHAARARHRGKRPKSGYRDGRNRPKHQQQQATLRPGEEVIQCARAAVCSVNSSVLRCQATARAARYKCVMGTRGGLAVAVWGGHAPGVDQLPRKGGGFLPRVDQLPPCETPVRPLCRTQKRAVRLLTITLCCAASCRSAW